MSQSISQSQTRRSLHCNLLERSSCAWALEILGFLESDANVNAWPIDIMLFHTEF